jgi:hypothetical protein
MGLREVATFTTFHCVLNRNQWAPRALALRLLHQLIVTDGPVVIAIAETIERRWGARIRTRHLSRSAPFQSWPLRQSLMPALDLRYAPGANPLARLRVGAPVPDRPGTLGTLCLREWTSAQAADGLARQMLIQVSR